MNARNRIGAEVGQETTVDSARRPRPLTILHASIIDLNARSGANEHVTGIAGGLAAVGHRVHLVACFSDRNPTLHPAVHRHLVRLLGEGPVRSARRIAAATVSVARRIRPDIVYLRAFPLDYLLIARRLRALGIPYVLEVNSLMGPEYRARGKRLRGSVYDRLLRRTLVASRGWIVMSEGLRVSVEKLSGVCRPTLVGKNGFDPARTAVRESRRIVRDRMNVAERDRILVMAGFARPWHGADRAIDMLPELPPDTLLWLVGGPDAESERLLRRRAARLGVDKRLVILPWQKGERLCSLVAAADIGLGALALDRKGESQAQPLKTSLYLALGLPVLFNHHDPRLEADLPFVSVVSESTARALASGARRLLDLPERHREQATEFAHRRLTWDAAAAEVAAFLEPLVGESST